MIIIIYLPIFEGWAPVTGSGCGPPEMVPGTAVGIGYGHGVAAVGGDRVETPGPLVSGGDGVGM